MSGGGHSSAALNWEDYRKEQEALKRLMSGDGEYGGAAKVKCDYCGGSYRIPANSIMQKCPSCGART